MVDACRQARRRSRAGGPCVGLVVGGVCHGVSAAGSPRTVEIATRTWLRDSGNRGHGGPAARVDPRRLREIPDGGGRVRYRRDRFTRCASSRTACHGARASGTRSCARGARRRARTNQERTVVRRHQPEEHLVGRAADRSSSTPSVPGSATRHSSLAFCLNHLLLKTLWVPSVKRELLTSFDAMTAA